MKLHGPAALGLGFQCSFDLRHGGDMANPFFSPTVERAPTGTVDFGEAPRTVGFAWAATHQCSSKLGRQLRFGQDFLKLRIVGAVFIGRNGLSLTWIQITKITKK
jgi:hypothetical protein